MGYIYHPPFGQQPRFSPSLSLISYHRPNSYVVFHCTSIVQCSVKPGILFSSITGSENSTDRSSYAIGKRYLLLTTHPLESALPLFDGRGWVTWRVRACMDAALFYAEISNEQTALSTQTANEFLRDWASIGKEEMSSSISQLGDKMEEKHWLKKPGGDDPVCVWKVHERLRHRRPTRL